MHVCVCCSLTYRLAVPWCAVAVCWQVWCHTTTPILCTRQSTISSLGYRPIRRYVTMQIVNGNNVIANWHCLNLSSVASTASVKGCLPAHIAHRQVSVHYPDINAICQTFLHNRYCVIAGFLRGVNEMCAFQDFTQRRMLVCYRRFRTTYPSHLQGSWLLEMGPIVCPEVYVKFPEECISNGHFADQHSR